MSLISYTIHEHKDITIFIIHYITEMTPTINNNSSGQAIITSGFSHKCTLKCWHNAIRVRAKPCVHRFNYSRTLPQTVPRQGCGHS